jgi:regulator of sigma E protease
MPHLLHAARSIAAFLLAADALIIAHELGHLLAARAFGVRAAKFTIGIGPTLATRRDRHGTTWRLALIPAGGYVSFHGDTNAGAPVGYGALPPLPRIG